MKTKNNKRITTLAVLGAVGLVLAYLLGRSIFSVGSGVEASAPDGESFSILTISGTIQRTPKSPLDTVSYNHENLMDAIDYLIDDEDNKGILLDVDSGGGTVYHSDELYEKLLEYKAETGRPVYAYFRQTAASGAYYISCAADKIMANRNCWTGSIGVIISYYNYSELLNKLGVEEVIIASGENKGMGSRANQLTNNQRDIYQSLVDESYERFVSIVAKGRKLDKQDVYNLADGRVYTASQALELGLVDEICSYEDAIREMENLTGAEGYHITFSSDLSLLDYLFAKAGQITPKNQAETVRGMFSQQVNGVPLYYFKG